MKTLGILIVAVLALSILPTMVMAAGASGSLGGDIGVEEFTPVVFQCGDRVVLDDAIQPWRTSTLGEDLIERNQHYLFEGERYEVDALVFDKNKVEEDVVDMVLADEISNPIDAAFEGNCYKVAESDINFSDCNARIDEQTLTSYDPSTMQAWRCFIDIQPTEQMAGEYWMAVRATSGLTGEEGIYDEVAKWYINPEITINVDGALDFSGVRPGTAKYSTVLVTNDAEGGVLLDMFITGKNWPTADTAPLGRCWDAGTSQLVNYLPLSAFSYYAENGDYSTRDDAATDLNNYDSGTTRTVDSEGYVNIQRQLNDGFEEEMFNEAEIIQANPFSVGGPNPGYYANILYPGSVGMSMTFRLMLPEPCYGNFESETDGSIFIWAEAI